jgi:clan AA aspartic protease (TIGR02281 family)
MGFRNTACAVLLCASGVFAVHCYAEECAEQYFSPDDFQGAKPLKSPHPDFVKTRKLASGGNAVDERSLAVYYESGYLVSPCAEKAAYWYSRAAQHGDDVAKAWVDRHDTFERLRNGPECFGDGCGEAGSGGSQVAYLQRNAGGAFIAEVKINGKPLRAVIDTGASLVSMGAKTAKALGIDYAGGRQLTMHTANGLAANRAVMLQSVTVGNITLHDVPASVGETDMAVLIGMSFLRRVSISTNGDSMTLTKR